MNAILFAVLLVMTFRAELVGSPAAAQEVLREERTVVVGQDREQWRLVWKSPPKPACMPDDGLEVVWATCPCAGFAFGERGDLDLVRVSRTTPEDRLSLTPAFDQEIVDWGQTAILPRWAVHDDDRESARDSPEAQAARIRRRPQLEIMKLRDFDHDGRATEFFVQVEAAPCGKHMGVVFGISKDRPNLHVFASAAHPNAPLVLRADHWEALARSAGSTTRVDWLCGDHGTSSQEELQLQADARGIHVVRLFYGCNANGTRGSLIRSEEQ
jgi:hypothetical protein